MKTEVKNVTAASIEISKLNPRQINKIELKKSDLYRSIKENGVQHPIEVRLVGDKNVLLSGERRLLIAKELKLKTIPAVVYSDMTDQEAYDKTHFENLARENLNPMEAAMDAQNLMQVHKGDREAVAARLGLSDRELQLRPKLKSLSPRWKETLEKQVNNMHELSIAHLELIARLRSEYQDEMLDDTDWVSDYDGNIISVAELKQYIDGHYTRLLKEASFDRTAPNLAVPQACVECDKRSDRQDQLGLWGGDKQEDAKCLDANCWASKSLAHLKNAIEASRKKHPDLLILGDRRMPEDIGKTADIYRFKKCKKTEPGALPSVTFDYSNMSIGQVNYVRPVSSGSTGAGNLPKSDAPKSMTVRKEELRGLRLKITIEELMKFMEKSVPVAKFNTVEYIASLFCMFGGHHSGLSDNKDLEVMDKNFKDTTILAGGGVLAEGNIQTILWDVCRQTLLHILKPFNGLDAIRTESFASYVAYIIGWDFDAAFRQACKDKPEPKGWANLNEDGTPKARG